MDIGNGRALWLAAGIAALLVLCLVRAAGLSIGIDRGSDLILWGSTAGACLLYRPPPGTWQQKLFDTLECIALFSLICALGAIASYAIVAMTHGYADALLAASDASLGFDWLALYRLTAAHRWIEFVGRSAYMSIFLTPTLLLVTLCWAGHAVAARRFLLAYGIALVIALMLFALVPAEAASFHYIGANPRYIPTTGLAYHATIEGLRSGTLTRIAIGSLAGLITFPSFHAASAILFAWGSWPVRRLRAPMLAINLTMLAATPIEGSHYLVDVIGGAGVALLAILAVCLRGTRVAAPRRADPQLTPA